MRPHEIAARFDDRAGYALVSYAEVGLPVYRIVASALMLVRKQLTPIDEFVLRCSGEGIKAVDEIAGFLGLERNIVEASATNLIRSDDVFIREGRYVELSQKGRRVLIEEANVRPAEQTVAFDYDGLIRKPRWYGAMKLLSPSEARRDDLFEIRAFPARKPEVDELSVDDVAPVWAKLDRGGQPERQLLRLKKIFKAYRLLLPALALVYRSDGNESVQVGFAINGRVSPDHELAFATVEGPAKLGIENAILSERNELNLEEICGQAIAQQIVDEHGRVRDEAERARKAAAIANFKAGIAGKSFSEAASPEAKEKAQAKVERTERASRELSDDLGKISVRVVPAYEHPALLHKAVNTARRSLIVLSPVVMSSVMDALFAERIQKKLLSGVDIYIGYREFRGRDGGKGSAQGAGNQLFHLRKRFGNLHIRQFDRLRTSALVWDEEFLMMATGDVLSLRGAKDSVFTENWGLVVAVPEIVVAVEDRLRSAFQEGALV